MQNYNYYAAIQLNNVDMIQFFIAIFMQPMVVKFIECCMSVKMAVSDVMGI